MRVVSSVFLHESFFFFAFASLAISLHYTRLMVFLLHDSDFVAQTTNIFSVRSLSLPLKYLQFLLFGLVIHHTVCNNSTRLLPCAFNIWSALYGWSTKQLEQKLHGNIRCDLFSLSAAAGL